MTNGETRFESKKHEPVAAGEDLGEAIKDSVPPELQEATEGALGFVTNQAKANPLLALLIAALVGYVIALLTA